MYEIPAPIEAITTGLIVIQFNSKPFAIREYKPVIKAHMTVTIIPLIKSREFRRRNFDLMLNLYFQTEMVNYTKFTKNKQISGGIYQLI